ncbi:MAG: efflux RND transporter periplasmic adaptor subunit [Acidobacteria bacterium]|nr:efflux RND transporter periplasmic adaptor subunit [Acidobacteriota bacterium]
MHSRSLALLLLVGVSACGSSAPATTSPAATGAGGARGGGAAAPVSVAPVVERAMPVTLKAVGTVQASSTVDVRSQVTGQLLAVGFTEGQDVKAGDTLFTLDARPFQATLSQAEAVLARDTAQAGNVNEQLKRADELLAKGMLPRADRDTLAANVAALRGTLAADTASVDNARLQVQYTRITAPVSGRTGALMVHQGALIRANDTTPLVTINQTSPVHVAFAVPARVLTRVRADQQRGALKVQVSIPGAAGAVATGALTFIDSSVDSGTDTIRVKGTFTNAERQLWPGQYVDVTLQLSVEPHAIVVPTAAVQASQQGQFVYVVKSDNTVEARPVRVAWTDAGTTVIESGLTAAERVVTDGQLRLTAGAKISIKPAIGSKDAPSSGQ